MTDLTSTTTLSRWRTSVQNAFHCLHALDNGTGTTATAPPTLPARRLVMLLRTVALHVSSIHPTRWRLTTTTLSGFTSKSIVQPIQDMPPHLTQKEWQECLLRILRPDMEKEEEEEEEKEKEEPPVTQQPKGKPKGVKTTVVADIKMVNKLPAGIIKKETYIGYSYI